MATREKEGYTVIVREILEREEFVPMSKKIQSPEDALDYIEEKYDNEDIVLDSDDYTETTFICGKMERNRCN